MGFRFNPLTSEFNIVDGVGTGTVTSVGLTVPAVLLNVSGSPVTTSGTLATTLASQSANKLFASPDGSSGTPTFRQLVYGDVNSGIASIGKVLTSNGSAGATWESAGGSSTCLGAIYQMDAAQALTDSGYSVINFATSVYDSGSHVSNAATNWLYTVGTGEGGIYQLSLMLLFEITSNSSPAAGAFTIAGRTAYGATEKRLFFELSAAAGISPAMVVDGCVQVELADGDTVNFQAVLNTGVNGRVGSAQPYDSMVSVIRLGDS